MPSDDNELRGKGEVGDLDKVLRRGIAQVGKRIRRAPALKATDQRSASTDVPRILIAQGDVEYDNTATRMAMHMAQSK